MEYADILQSFESAESVGFFKVPLPVPPVIEAAFRYQGTGSTSPLVSVFTAVS